MEQPRYSRTDSVWRLLFSPDDIEIRECTVCAIRVTEHMDGSQTNECFIEDPQGPVNANRYWILEEHLCPSFERAELKRNSALQEREWKKNNYR